VIRVERWREARDRRSSPRRGAQNPLSMRSPIGEILRLGLAPPALALRPRGSSVPAGPDEGGVGAGLGPGCPICGRPTVDAGGEGGLGLPPKPPTEKRRKRPSPSLPADDDDAGAPALVTRPRGTPI